MYRKMVLILSAVLLVALAGNAFGQTVPAGGWTEDVAVGANTTPGGSVSPEAGTYEVTGNGWDIDQQADGFQYLYKELVGDGSMTARVVDNGTGSNSWAKGGVMIRQSTDDDSQHAFTCITGSSGGGAAYQQRTETASTQTTFHDLAGGPYAPPYWVRIERVGDDLSSFISADGENWTQAGDTLVIAMQDPVLIGLAVTSHAEGELRTYIFDNLSFTGEVSGESDPGAASVPSPDDEAVDVPRDVVLGWAAGVYPGTHDIYLGTSFDDVNDASRANPMDVLLSQGQSGTMLDAESLEFSQTYYWRVDEVNSVGSAIFKSDVWSFTTEPFAYPVANIIATSNATSDEGVGPERTVDGSGLDELDQHSIDAGDMWLCTAGAEPVYLQYEFDGVYKLHQMLVWNYNVQFEMMLGFGPKDVTVEYSENGTDWTVLEEAVFAQGTSQAGYAANTVVDFGGVVVKYVKLTVNSSYSTGMLPVPQYGLSEVRFLYIPAQAREPQPAVGATGVVVESALNWRAGREAVTHDVYLSMDPNALALAASVGETTYVPGDLEFGSTYYWRIDEVNEADEVSVWAGTLWNFVTEEYALIDDMESYDDDENRIYDTWLDGWVNETRSTVGYFEAPFAETSIVNSGSQSMPLEYDNSDSPFYAEAEKDLGGMNLTGNGADTLRLFVSGLAPAFSENTDGTILMNAIGNDIWDNTDQFRYAYKSLTGDGSMIARVDDLDSSPSTWAKAGVMIRQDTAGGSVHAFMAMTGGDGNGYSFQRRLEAGGISTGDNGVVPAIAPPYWVKVERVGNVFTGSISPDGTEWTVFGDPQTIEMDNAVLIGLALTSHNVSVATSAQFSNVSFTGSVSGALEIAEIGATQPEGNTPQPIYVAVEDNSGKVAVVTHPDAAASARSGWTEWLIPYSDLAGVNLSSISTMYIGVGDRDNPTTGGTGTIFIDDVGYGRPAPVVEPDDAVVE